MISALLLSLALGQLLPKDPPIRPRVFRSDGAGRISRLGSDDFAFFEAFPANGAGTSGACSTTPPTGAKGEVLTFTRASNGTCTKTASGGLATTGIADGDLVVLSSNQPRVEYDSAGTLGLLVEASRTNSLLRSQEFDNAAWSSSTGAGAVTVTADQAIAPDGTLTADRLQVSACPTAGTYSARLQAMALVSTRTWSVYVRGNGTSGNIGMIVGGGAVYSGVVCPYVSTSWTRCSVSANAGAGDAWVGCVNATVASPNPGNTGAADVFVWGGQVEDGPYATSYIPTGAGTATRGAETASFAVTSGPADTSWSSASTTASLPTVSYTAGASPLGLLSGGVGKLADYIFSTTFQATGVCFPRANMAITVGGPRRIANWIGGGQCAAIIDGTSQSGTAGGTSAVIDTVRVGYSTAAGPIDSIVSRICLDPDPSRCR